MKTSVPVVRECWAKVYNINTDKLGWEKVSLKRANLIRPYTSVAPIDPKNPDQVPERGRGASWNDFHQW